MHFLKTTLSLAFVAALTLGAQSASAKDICAATAFGNNDEAQAACPAVCASVAFNGNWTNEAQNVEAAGCSGVSVCGTNHGDVCADTAYMGNDDAQASCPAVVDALHSSNGNWTNEAANVEAAGCSGVSVCGCGG